MGTTRETPLLFLSQSMATDQYYMHMARQNAAMIENKTVESHTQEAPMRDIRHFRLTKQSKLRHCAVMREKVMEIPERLQVDDSNDPLAGDDADAIISRRMAEQVNNRRTATGGYFTS